MNLRELLVGIGFNVNKKSFDTAEAKIESVKDGLDSVAKNSDTVAKKTSRNIAKIGDSADGVGNKISNLLDRFNALLAVVGVTVSVSQLISMVDQWKTIAGQVKNVTKSEREALEVQKELYQIADRTRQSYASTSQLFTSIARNSSELGKSNGEILNFTEDVSNAMILGGGDAASQSAALVQLGQALGSGTLRGDELNSIMEQAPRLAKVIADGMGVTIGQLRNLGAEGKLTAIDVFNAVRSQSDRLKMEMGKMPWTFEQALTKMSNKLGNFFYNIEKRTGIVSSLAEGMADVADAIDSIDVDRVVAGMRMLVIYATAFFVVSKWSVILKGFHLLRTYIIAVKDAYLLASGAQIVFQTGSARSAAFAVLAMGKFLLIAAAITAVVFVIQDFYKWVQGGDSVIGEHLGKWSDFTDSCKEKWDSFTQAIEDFLNMRVIDIIKNAIGWIGELQDKVASLNVREKVSNWWQENVSDPVNDTLYGVINGASAQGPQANAQVAAAYGRYSGVSGARNISNSGNVTNHITVNAKTNASPTEIATAVANETGPARIPTGFDGGDSFEPALEG